jgi:biotin-(acetyl-CoA carboxylase) ligase
VGLNVTNRVRAELEASAVSLACLGIAPDLSDLTDRVVAALRKLELSGGALSPSELRRFAARDFLQGRAIREPVAGIVRGLSADGALLVQPDSGPFIQLRTGSVMLADSLTAGNFDHAARTGHR